jgi:hypothetical protein
MVPDALTTGASGCSDQPPHFVSWLAKCRCAIKTVCQNGALFQPIDQNEGKRKSPAARPGFCLNAPVGGADYFSAVWTLVKVVFSLEPRPETTVMIATEMPAAIRPYSMAVAPDSSFTKHASSFFMGMASLFPDRGHEYQQFPENQRRCLLKIE